MNKIETAFDKALKDQGLRSAKPIPVGKGVRIRMYKRAGSALRQDMRVAILGVLRRG